MTKKNVYSCPHCEMDLKVVGVSILRGLYNYVRFRKGKWDYDEAIVNRHTVYCANCKCEISDETILKKIEKNKWIEVLYL